MRMSRNLLALAALALAAPLAGQGFEGTLKQQQVTVMPQGVVTLVGSDITDPQKVLEAVAGKVKGADPSLVQASDMTVSVKGAKMRIDGMNSGMGAGAYSIMDAGAGMMYTIMPQQKQIMTLSGADAVNVGKRMSEQMGLAPAPTTPPTKTDLGVKQVGGVQAHGYRLTTRDGVAIVWVDPAMKDAFSAFNDFQQKMSSLNPVTGPLQGALNALGFPVSVQLVVKAPPIMGEGWLYSEVVVNGVQKQPVADDVFALPADFTRTDMAKMMP